MKRRKKSPIPLDAVKTRTAFLWIPRTCDGETRWLETATWEEGRRNNKYDEWWYMKRWVD